MKPARTSVLKTLKTKAFASIKAVNIGVATTQAEYE